MLELFVEVYFLCIFELKSLDRHYLLHILTLRLSNEFNPNQHGVLATLISTGGAQSALFGILT